jgi:hypothetical protein
LQTPLLSVPFPCVLVSSYHLLLANITIFYCLSSPVRLGSLWKKRAWPLFSVPRSNVCAQINGYSHSARSPSYIFLSALVFRDTYLDTVYLHSQFWSLLWVTLRHPSALYITEHLKSSKNLRNLHQIEIPK